MPNPVIPRGFIPLISGYGISAPGGVMATPVSGGSPRFALEYDRGAQQFQISFVMSEDKFAVWSVFFHKIIKKGAITFTMKMDSGTGVVDHDVNILPESYSATAIPASRHKSVTFVAVCECKVNDFSDEEAQTILDLWELYGGGTGGGSGLLDRIAQFANVDSLVLDF